VAWLSLDKDDNQAGRFLNYLVAALRGADHAIGSEAAQLLATSRSGIAAGAVINTVAASCLLARLHAVQGLLRKSCETYQAAARLILGAGDQHLGAKALVEVGMADVLCERNDLRAALAHLEQGLALMSWWGKTDDFILAYVTLARIRLARADKRDATEAVEKANQLIHTRGVFSEARQAAEVAQVKLWLAQGDLPAAGRWAAAQAARLRSGERFAFENELTHIAQARALIALHRPHEAIALLSKLEESAQAAGRMGRVIEILLLQGLALREMDDSDRALPGPGQDQPGDRRAAHRIPWYRQSPHGQHLSQVGRRQPDRGGRARPTARHPPLISDKPCK
jgi:LuxR family maltose regulon positive regulatory protein